LRRGPWPESVAERLITALDTLTRRLREFDGLAAIVVFGSYARGEFGRTSDVDLLILLDTPEAPEQSDLGHAILQQIGEIEAEARLPMHVAALVVSARQPTDVGPQLLHDVWADGIVLYARAGALARLRAEDLGPWTVIRFSAARAAPHERVRLSRRLHGMDGRPGILQPPALELGRGALLVPADMRRAVCDALDEAGATYDALPVWRE